MSLVPGHKFYEYDIIRRIGKGGFGAIYEAQDTLLDRRVAIKELLLSHAEDEVTLKRFIQEARTAGSINHPAIVTVYGLKKEGTDYYLIMEFVGGGSLRTLLQEQGKLSVEKAVDIVISVCDGLAAVHEKGIVHRDIKPDNILLTENGRVKIADFGSAHVPRQTGRTALTRTGFHPGTFIYMSPEQALGRSIDRRSDLYNIGVLLYELITGRFYLQTENGDQLGIRLDSLLTNKNPVVPPTVYEPTTPPALEQVIMKCLARDRDDRYQTAREIIEALRVATAQGLGVVPPPGGVAGRKVSTDHAPVQKGLAQAFAALEQGRLETAAGAFRGLVNEDPRSAEAHYGLASVLSRQRQYEQAIRAFQQAVKLRPDYVEALMGLAYAFKQTSSYRAAIDIYNQVIRLDPNHAWAYFHLGDTYKVLGKLDQAFSAFQEANTRVRDDLDDANSCQLLIRLAEAYKSLDMSTHATIALQRAVRIKPEQVLDFYAEDIQRGDETIYHQLGSGLQQAIKADPQRAALYHNLGRVYAWGPHPEQAIEELQQAISADPQYIDAHLTLAEVYHRLGKDKLALDKYQDIIHMAPKRPEAYRGLGSIYVAQDKIGKAIGAYQQAIDLKPDYAEAQAELIEALKRVVQREPRRAEVHFYLGLAYAAQGDLWRAASAFQQAVRLRPDASEARDNLIATLEELAENNPRDTEVYFHLGTAYASAGRMHKAVGAFLRATKLAPEDDEIKNNLLDALEQAVRIGTDNAEAYYYLGNLYLERGDLDQALPRLEEAIRLDPTHSQARVALADTYQQLGRVQDAISEYSKALEIRPRDASAHFHLALAYESEERVYETARALERAITYNPDHIMAHFRLGNLYYSQERLDDAAREYQEVIHRQPDHVGAHFQLGMVYFRQQRFDLAACEFEETIRIDADHLRAHDMLTQARLWLGATTAQQREVL